MYDAGVERARLSLFVIKRTIHVALQFVRGGVEDECHVSPRPGWNRPPAGEVIGLRSAKESAHPQHFGRAVSDIPPVAPSLFRNLPAIGLRIRVVPPDIDIRPTG